MRKIQNKTGKGYIFERTPFALRRKHCYINRIYSVIKYNANILGLFRDQVCGEQSLRNWPNRYRIEAPFSVRLNTYSEQRRIILVAQIYMEAQTYHVCNTLHQIVQVAEHANYNMVKGYYDVYSEDLILSAFAPAGYSLSFFSVHL